MNITLFFPEEILYYCLAEVQLLLYVQYATVKHCTNITRKKNVAKTPVDSFI